MAERTRPIRIEFCVTEQERQLIQNKMAQLEHGRISPQDGD